MQQGEFRILEQVERIARVAPKRDASARRRKNLAPVEIIGRAADFDDGLAESARLPVVAKKDRKRVAADAKNLGRAGKTGGQSRRHLIEDLVAARIAETCVNAFEPVDVEKREG